MMTLQSAPLLPGATPAVQTAEQRDAFLRRIDDDLRWFHETLGGIAAPVSDIGHALATKG